MKEIISPVDTEDGLFHDGDPSTGTEGTVVSQKWLNPVQGAIISNQQELASVLKEAGIKIDPAKQDQLLAAIKKITGTATEGFLKVGDFGLGGSAVAKNDAYSNLAQFYRVDDKAANKPPIQGTSAGVVSLPIDGAPTSGYLAISGKGQGWIGYSTIPANGIKWNQLYSTANPPKALETGAADWSNNFAARMGVSRVLSGANLPTSPGVWSVENCSWTGTPWGSLICTTNSSDLSTTPGSGRFQHYVQISHEAGGKPGLRLALNVNGTLSSWSRVYTTDYKPSASDVGLGNAGDFLAVQQGGGANQSTSKVYIGWGNDGILRCTVDSTDLGQIYTTKSPPKASETGAFPITGGNLQGGINAIGGVGTQGGAFFIRNSDGVQVASVSAQSNGSISVYSDTTRRSFGIANDGNFYTSSGVQIVESGQRVYSPNNPPPVASQAVTNARLTGRINQPDTGGQVRVPDGCVFTGMSGANYNSSIWASYSYIQVLINGTWRNIGTS